jgi:hypothetical protein
LLLSFVLGAVGLYQIAGTFFVRGRLRFGNPVSAGATRITDPTERSVAPRRVRIEVTRVKGDLGISPGAKCEFLVEKRPLKNGTFYCNAQITCGSKLLYGGQERGYFTCALYDLPRRDIVGSDPTTSASDHDAALHLDTQAGVLRVWDDEQGPNGKFEVEADVLSVD